METMTNTTPAWASKALKIIAAKKNTAVQSTNWNTVIVNSTAEIKNLKKQLKAAKQELALLNKGE